MKNDPAPTANARAPRGAVILNGQSVAYISIDIDTNAYLEADTATVTLAEEALSADRNLAYLKAQRSIEVELKIGFPADPQNFTAAELQTLFVGNADVIRHDPIARTITLTCRDLTALLIDVKTSEKFPNLTASALASKIAGEHGLTPVVTATAQKIGSFYQIDHVRSQREQTKWELLTWCAREENYVVYVSGRELHFKPRPTAEQDPYVFQLSDVDGVTHGNLTTISFEKSLTITKGVKVIVRSWNHRAGRRITKTAGGGGAAQEYAYSIPGLTAEQAQSRADALHAELSSHAVRVEIAGPADNLLGIDDVIRLIGTDWDQAFFPASIARHLSLDQGYRWSISAQNRSNEDGAETA